MIPAATAQLCADLIRARESASSAAMTGTAEQFAAAIRRVDEVREQLARLEETF